MKIQRHDRSDRMKTRMIVAALVGAIGFPLWTAPALPQQEPPLTTAQRSALEEANQLAAQVERLYARGKYAEAVLPAEKALAIRERLLGENHPDTANSLNNLALLYTFQGLYEEAEPLLRRTIAIDEQRFGKNHPETARSLNNLALLYTYQERYGEAEPLYRRILAIQEQQLGKDHLDTANSLNNLALLYESQKRYEEAEPLYKRALAIQEQQLGKNHSSTADSLYNLANLYSSQKRYEEAEPLYKRALAIQEQQLGKNHPETARSLNNLANLYNSQKRYERAEPLYRRVLAINEQQLGKNHPETITSLNNLAGLYISQGRYGEAEPLYKRALAIQEQQLGKNHPNTIRSLNNLAGLYISQGHYGKAEPLLVRALAINEQQLGKNHPETVTSLDNLAGLYNSQGRYGEAEPLYKRALAIQEQQLGKNHSSTADSLNSLALLYESQGRYGEAEPLYVRALAINEQQLGKNHPETAKILNNLAARYNSQGRYGEAEPLYARALAISEQQLGENHPQTAIILSNLAVLYVFQGRYGEAEPLLLARAIQEQQLGKNNPGSASSLYALAFLYTAQGRYGEATQFLRRVMEIEEQTLAINLAVGAEDQKRAYIATITETTDAALSWHLQFALGNSDAAQLAFITVLRRKGRVLDALTNTLQQLRQRLTSTDQKLLDELASVRSQLAALIYQQASRNLSPEQYQTQLATLQKQSNQLEADLNNRSAEFRLEAQLVSINAVQKLIPPATALVEIIQYRSFNVKAKPDERWGKPRYAAYILFADGTLQWVDLGAAEPMNRQAETFRLALSRRDPQIKDSARKLDAMLMQPIRQKLGKTTKLLLSPDGQLNLIPFAALVDEQNRYLVETYEITYLTTGRDLLRLQNRVASKQPPVVIANPDYDKPGDPRSAQKVQQSTIVAAKPTRGTAQRSSDLKELQFGPLPGTLAEAKAIAPKLPNVTLLMGSEATENALKQVQAPKILHIATHGFFLGDIPFVAPEPTRRGDALRAGLIARPTGGPATPGPVNLENALLRSGLALAGFNPRSSGSEDGVLTALEAANLDLRGTQLVVLSACETGVGDVANGEGVYGLRRAFVMAGAESLVFSFWQVSDEGTKDLMVQYYDRLLKGEGRTAALRQVQLDMLKSSRYSHPYYWSAFINSGDWRSL